MKSWLQDKGIETNSTHNERKLAVAEKFITTLTRARLGRSRPSPAIFCFVTIF